MNFYDLTQFVNSSLAASASEGAQLQVLRSHRLGSGWGLLFDFYRSPRNLLIALGPDSTPGFTEDFPTKLPTSPCPLQLYLKAHFTNQRLRHIGLEGDELVMEFVPRLLKLRLRFEGKDLIATCEIPDRAPYTQRMTLGTAPQPVQASNAETPSEAASNAPSSREEKLLQNIQGDITEAGSWIEKFAPICERLEAEPSLWENPAGWSEAERTLLEVEISAGRLPPWGRASLGRAQDILYKERRRTKRRIVGGEKRLQDVKRRMDRGEKVSRKRPNASAPQTDSPQSSSHPQKKPGLWVSLKEDGSLWARVGKSAQENAELFRQANDRDLWFHVHGQAGGHVWIPRGQKGLGRKDSASEDIVRMGCQLALLNSKARASGSATVDFTERRNLRPIRSAGPGQLEILRSETRFTRADAEFEEKVFGRSRS